MKKFLILASILLVFTLVFVACTEKKPGEETSGENVTVADPVTNAPTEEPTAPIEDPTQKPEDPTQKPEDPTQKPEDPTQKPEDPTEKPEDPTEPPVVDPNAPVYSVEAEILSEYASRTGDLWSVLDIGSWEVKTEGNRTFARMTANGPDPYFIFTECHYERKIGRYMAISYRTNLPVEGTIFMGPGECWNGMDDCFEVVWNEDENWNLVVIDLLQTGITSLTGDSINYGRFSIYEGKSGHTADPADYFDVEYVAFFNTSDAAEKYDAEMHKSPMWDADKAVVAHQSFDQFYYGNGDHDAAVNDNLCLYHAANLPNWDFIADMRGKDYEYLTYWGWIATKSETIGQFGYQFNGDAPVYDDAWTHATEQPVIDAAKQQGGVNGSRMKIFISLAELPLGENALRILYKDADGNEVCLNEVTVIMPEADSHEHSYESVVTAPTCSEAGYTTYTCACGDSYVADEVEALGHDTVTDAAVEPTCTATGLTAGEHCSRCDYKVAQETVDALGHSFAEGTCSVCGEADPDYVAPETPVVPAYVAGPDKLVGFGSMAGDIWHSHEIVSSQVKNENGRTFAHFTSNGTNPYIVFVENNTNQTVGRYMAISYRTTYVNGGQIMMGAGVWGGAEGCSFMQAWNADGNWHLLIIDLESAGMTQYIVNHGRFDLSVGVQLTENDYFDLEYIAFFDSAEDAEKYDAELDRTPDVEPETPVVPAYVAGPDKLVGFGSMAGDIWHSHEIVSSQVKNENGRTFAHFTSNGTNPYIVFVENNTNQTVGRYMAISYRTTYVNGGQIMMGAGVWGGAEGCSFMQAWNADGNWHLLIIDLESAGMTQYIVNHGRFDLSVGAQLTENEYFDLEYIAFFDSAEDAEKYDAELDRTPDVEPDEP